MSSFEKFMKDLEARNELKNKQKQRHQAAEQNHHQRLRLARFAENWQNAVRFVGHVRGDT